MQIMNKCILTLASVALAVMNCFGVNQQYFSGGFQFVPSARSSAVDECPMSFYKKGSIVFFRNDSAFMVNKQKDLDMGKPTLCKELMGLDIAGTFAYDKRNAKIYFTRKSDGDNSVIYEATENQGKWDNIKPVDMLGTLVYEQEIKGTTLKHGRYVFYTEGAKGLHNPALANNGKRLYFSATFSTGKGDRDLWYSDLDEKTAIWSRPCPVGDSLNTEFNEDFPFVVGDTALYFSAERADGMGGMDLYVSILDKKNNVWKPAQNLGDIFNSSANEYNIISQGDAVYFLSDRIDEGKGGADIYFPTVRHIEPGAELVADVREEEPLDFNWVLFFFDINKSNMKPEYEVQLDELATAMMEFPDAKFVIRGYTDSRGSVELNKKLSLQRATYIRQLLVYRGFNAKRITVIGKGMEDPVIPNAQTEFEHEQNRRVEIQLLAY